MRRILVCWIAALTAGSVLAAENFVAFESQPDFAVFADKGFQINIVVSGNEYKGVRMAAENLADDIAKVCGAEVNIANSPKNGDAVRNIFVGSLQHGKDLKKSSVARLKDKAEMFIIEVKDNGDVVIAGSDKRGTIYGVYELSEQLGVSPWYWWADVPIEKHERLWMKKGEFSDGEPAVRYRGIFLNDEAPCLTSWVKNSFGTQRGGHQFYAKVFELILRLKGNLLWPAMWAWAFYADDPLNAQTADDMGVVIGTSHHEPMARNHQEWARNRKKYGAWNYSTNQKTIDDFFREGIKRMNGKENIVTIGMRGDGDEAMSKDTDTKLLEKVIRNQRKIIQQETGKNAAQTPQVWALYKEVLDYYDAGLRAPDDVIMLLCDDNWGNVRRLPNAEERKHKGGWGMYYHVDYVGAPRNSKWICNTPIQNMWEQLTLTYEYGVDKLWILNVGDLKPMEYSISEFLDLAWNPGAYNVDNLLDHTVAWCAQQFGKQNADEAARILNKCLKYNGRVTAEMLDSKTYDLKSGEWERVVNEYKALEVDALRLAMKMDDKYKDAFFEIVLYPVQAMANLYEMYYAKAMNDMLYPANNPEANYWADKVEECFKRDAELSRQYNEDIANGKWNGMMTQKHIGYTSWNDNFPADVLPQVNRVAMITYDGGDMANTGGYVFSESDNVVNIEAEHFFKKSQPKSPKASWTIIPDMGRTLSGIAVMPYTENVDGAALTYKFSTNGDGSERDAVIGVMVKSNLAFARKEGHRYSISVDGGEEIVVNFNKDLNEDPKNVYTVYYPTVARRVKTDEVKCRIKGKGEHSLTIRPLDPGVVFEKIYINLDGKKRNLYLGGKESPSQR